MTNETTLNGANTNDRQASKSHSFFVLVWATIVFSEQVRYMQFSRECLTVLGNWCLQYYGHPNHDVTKMLISEMSFYQFFGSRRAKKLKYRILKSKFIRTNLYYSTIVSCGLEILSQMTSVSSLASVLKIWHFSHFQRMAVVFCYFLKIHF